MAGQGWFRDDLFYRLKAVRIDLPPLRERGEDIRLLLKHFLSHFKSRFGKNIPGDSGQALSLPMRYSDPGNERELKNIVEHATGVCPWGSINATELCNASC